MGLTTSPFFVATVEDAHEAIATASWLGGDRRIVLADAHLSDADKQRWERRLNFWSLACGCHSGAALALITFGWCAVRFPDAPGPMAITLVNDAGFVIGAALAGKVAGLAVARTMFVVHLARLGRRLAASSPGAA